MDNETVKLPWYKKAWFMWVMLLFFYPIGLYILYLRRDIYSKQHMGIIAAIMGFLFIYGIYSSHNPTTNTPSDTSAPVVATTTTEEKKNYTEVTIDTMVEELRGNAAAAQKKYKGKYVKITGTLVNIDSDGDYINIAPSAYSIIGASLHPQKGNKAQESYILNAQKGQTVTAYGKITNVGEVIGYFMDVDKFE